MICSQRSSLQSKELMYSRICTFILPLVLATSLKAAQDTLSVPRIDPIRSASFQKRSISPFAGRCESLFNVRSSAKLTGTRKVIASANKSFLRRGWGEEFLNERFDLAKRVKERSQYFYLKKPSLGKSDNIVSTLGLTWATYDKHEMPEGEVSVASQPHHQYLPGEHSLESIPFPRPLCRDGKGIIMELRTWSIDKVRLSPNERVEAFDALISDLIVAVFKRTQDYPELYDKPILYLYADEVSLKLYRMMGFENLSKQPVSHSGTNWWVMAISPKKLESFVLRMRQPEILDALNQELAIATPLGEIVAAPGSLILNNESSWVKKGGVSHWIDHLAQDTELAPGLWAAKGSSVSISTEGKILSIERISRPYQLNPKLVADVGSGIGWDHSGNLISLSRLATKTQVDPGIWAEAGSGVRWSQGRIYYVEMLAEALILSRKLTIPVGSEVRWNPLRDFEVMYFDKRTRKAQRCILEAAERGAVRIGC